MAAVNVCARGSINVTVETRDVNCAPMLHIRGGPGTFAAATIRRIGACLTFLVVGRPHLRPPGPWLEATVIAITDGDTLWAEIAEPGHGLAAAREGAPGRDRLPGEGSSPWGAQATARLSALVLGASVQIEVALQSRDRYGRLLGSIWRDGQLVQEQLVREGLCVPYTVPPNVEYVDRIRAAAEQARRDGVGIYAPAGPLLESPASLAGAGSGTDQP